VLQIAPSGYWRHAAARRNPALRSERSKRADILAPQVQRVWQANMQVYGADKVWRQMNREGVTVARCTVERLMRQLGLRGVIRGKVVRTTVADTQGGLPARSGQPGVQGGSPQPAVGLGLHLRLDLARLAVRGLRDESPRLS